MPANTTEIAAQDWSLIPGRYVGAADRAPDGFVFTEHLEELNEELKPLNAKAHDLEERITETVTRLPEGSG